MTQNIQIEEMRKIVHGIGVEAVEFTAALAKESERASVVLGAARLEFALEKLLKKIMLPHANDYDNLFDSDRPLGSFSAKIALSYRLGLIDDDFEHALQMIRKIRNDFAHSIQNESLSESKHSNRIREVVNLLKKSNLWKHINTDEIRKVIQSNDFADFCIATAFMIAHLETITLLNNRFKIKHLISFNFF